MKTKHICSELKCLRSLDFGNYEDWRFSIPNSIGELKHLTYLKFQSSSEVLPDGLTRLQHLQTLDVGHHYLKELPRRFNKLTNLRHLKLAKRIDLNDMPPGFWELKSLVHLDQFIVGGNNGVDAMGSMNLGGDLEVYFKKRRPNVVVESRAANLKGKKLISLRLVWSSLVNEEKSRKEAEEELKWLQPPSTIKELCFMRWKGEEFPSWGMDGVPCLLPNLVCVQIENCGLCRHVPTFGRLPNLKYLTLRGLRAIEYIEGEGGEGSNCSNSNSNNRNSEGVGSSGVGSLGVDSSGVGSSGVGSSCASFTPYFPCLDELELNDMAEVKGWWGRESEIMIAKSELHNYLPHLRVLRIWGCPKLKTMVEPVLEYDHLSRLEKLDLFGCEELDLLKKDLQFDDTSLISSSSAWCHLRNLRVLRLGYLSKMERVPVGISCLTALEELDIRMLDNVKEIGGWIGQPTHLRKLQIVCCPKLKELPQSIATLSSLTHLLIDQCPELETIYRKPNGERWPRIQHIPRLNFWNNFLYW